MLVLIIKLDNLKEVISTLPALTDASKAIKGIKFDWLVSEQCSDVAEMHSAIRRVITPPSSKIDFNFFKSLMTGEFAQLKRQLQHNSYDLIIDAQGNTFSALMAKLANGEVSGYDSQSLSNSLLVNLYKQKQFVAKEQTMVERARQLFAKSLGYNIFDKSVNYGIIQSHSKVQGKKIQKQKQFIFCPGANTKIKQWPITNWIELANINTKKGFNIVIPWHSEEDKKLALTIKKACKLSDKIIIPKQINLAKLSQKFTASLAVISTDTGLAHLAGAMSTPVLTIYGPGNPTLKGCNFKNSVNISAQYQCSPCEKNRCSQAKKNETPPCFGNISSQNVQKHLTWALGKSFQSKPTTTTIRVEEKKDKSAQKSTDTQTKKNEKESLAGRVELPKVRNVA